MKMLPPNVMDLKYRPSVSSGVDVVWAEICCAKPAAEQTEGKPVTVSAGTDMRLSDGLAAVVGERYCKIEELTREALLSFAVSAGAAAAVVRVRVQRSDGESFEVVLEEANRCVREVKHCVAKAEGVAASSQDLFVLSKGDGGDDDEDGGIDGASEAPLDDNATVEDGWVLALLVRAGGRFVATGAATAISDPSSCIITQQKHGKASLSLTDLEAGAGGGAVYAEFKALSGDTAFSGDVDACIGAVVKKARLDLDKDHAVGDNDEAYFMNVFHGSLLGNENKNSNMQGDDLIKVGDTIGVYVQAGDSGFVAFYRNRKPFGTSSFTPGEEIRDFRGNPTGKILGSIKSPLVIAVQMENMGVSLQLVSEATVPAGV